MLEKRRSEPGHGTTVSTIRPRSPESRDRLTVIRKARSAGCSPGKERSGHLSIGAAGVAEGELGDSQLEDSAGRGSPALLPGLPAGFSPTLPSTRSLYPLPPPASEARRKASQS